MLLYDPSITTAYATKMTKLDDMKKNIYEELKTFIAVVS